MLKNKFLRTLLTAAGLGFVATAAVLSLGTSAPTAARAEIPAPLLERANGNGQVPSLAPMLKNVLPAVVNISVRGKVVINNPLMQDPFFRHFFNIPDQPQTQEFQAIGSGVIVDATHGYVLTNNHVVAQADDIRVKLKDGRDFKAKLIGHDPQTDIAVLQIKADHLTALPIADSDKLQVGDFVVAIGDPFGLGQTVTSGIVSALGRVTSADEYQDFIQTDASINPGNSGGALVNLNGQLVGINSQILTRSGGNMGIGFAIPTNLAVGVMQQLIKYGKVDRGQIGVMIQDLTPALAKALGVNTDHGVVVSRVIPGSPAAKAGLKAEDIIVAANGKPVTSGIELRNIVGLLRIGDTVKLTLLRNGEKKEVSVKVGKISSETASADDLFPALRGASYSALPPGGGPNGVRHGILVENVRPGSPADQSGLQNDDVIVSVNRQPVATLEQFRKLAGKNQSQVLLRVVRGDGALFLLLQR